MDRISIHVFVRPVDIAAFQERRRGERSTIVRRQVLAARKRQAARGNALNATMSEKAVRRYCKIDKGSSALLVTAQKRLRVSARGRGHILRVARTIADLEGAKTVTRDHVAEAVQYRIRELPR
jgi:magnesium chelatase family protein